MQELTDLLVRVFQSGQQRVPGQVAPTQPAVPPAQATVPPTQASVSPAQATVLQAQATVLPTSQQPNAHLHSIMDAARSTLVQTGRLDSFPKQSRNHTNPISSAHSVERLTAVTWLPLARPAYAFCPTGDYNMEFVFSNSVEYFGSVLRQCFSHVAARSFKVVLTD